MKGRLITNRRFAPLSVLLLIATVAPLGVAQNPPATKSPADPSSARFIAHRHLSPNRSLKLAIKSNPILSFASSKR